MWCIPTRNRPAAMRDLIEAMQRAGEIPNAAVMIDGDAALYADVQWPANWAVHQSETHLEYQRALNGLFELHPNEKTYGVITDHARPISPDWATQLDMTAGDWKIALCDDGRNRFNLRTGIRRMTSAISIGGELVRAMGFLWPNFCVHLWGDDALEEIGHELNLIEWRGDIRVDDLHFIDGQFPRDANHERVWQGRPYAESDRSAFMAWRAASKPELLDRIERLLPFKPDRPKPVTICCVQAGDYQGRGAQYVNVLYDMVLRSLPAGRPYSFVCFTDAPSGLHADIDARALPEPGLSGWWNKLALFKRGVFAEGERVFFLDLDTLVISALDSILTYGGKFAALRDFYRPDGLGSGLMSWVPECNYDIWDRWEAAGRPMPAGGDQSWIEEVRTDADRWQNLFAGQVVSYKVHCNPYPPKGAAVVCFHGEPRPHNCTQKWVQDAWKVGGAGALQLTTVPNMDTARVLENVRANEHAGPWLGKSAAHEEVAILCGSGPSLLSQLGFVRAIRGAGKVFALNNASNVLARNGIWSDFQVILDARKENVAFVGGADRFLIASQCDPSVFEAVAGNCTLWHPAIEGIEDLFPERSMTLIGGGTTVGLSAMALAYAMGFRRFALFGYDSSFMAGKTHAAPQPRTATEAFAFDVTVNDRTFQSNAAMAKQAELFPQFATQLADLDCEIRVFGDGLLPYIAQLMTGSGPVESSTQQELFNAGI